MSILARLLAWLGRSVPSARSQNPDCMTLHDWADLPTHHPKCG
ncbi:hypothetical protein SAMN06295905_2908 [Devosia lucknowensis]|uniref:Uncharacterized protein n=1 Tax=Devosia lucknowensis TaxID=1096929 RepID=A0A1Y6G618_9HYPH|nr:hypothetical protein [Devosia lucknowensis]SMQ85621.1 hypothetical protein SAMN06295905_2908 [Devosia lucknowensis]